MPGPNPKRSNEHANICKQHHRDVGMELMELNHRTVSRGEHLGHFDQLLLALAGCCRLDHAVPEMQHETASCAPPFHLFFFGAIRSEIQASSERLSLEIQGWLVVKLLLVGNATK